MVSSFHLVTFRRPKLLPPGRSPANIQGLRFWKALSTAKDTFLSPDRSHLGLLRPNLREWGFFGVWDSAADVDRFLADSPVAETWRDASTELWSVWLKPTRARGEWKGVKALDGVAQNGLPRAAPAAFITRLDLPLRAVGAMWLSAVPRLAPQLPSVEGLLLGVPIMDRPYFQPMTFSIWRSLDEAMSFAYRGAPHPQAVGRLRKTRKDIASRFSSAGFHPYRTDGTWKGVNPLLTEH
jgi:hypothetical protein